MPKLSYFILFFTSAFVDITDRQTGTSPPLSFIWLQTVSSIPSSDQRRALWRNLRLVLEKMVLL